MQQQHPQRSQMPPAPEAPPHRFFHYENRLRSETRKRKEFEVMGRVMNVDSGYYRTSQGFLKILEIVLSFLAILFVCNSYGVYGERSLALLVAFAAFFGSFVILVSRMLTLHLHCSHMGYFLTEFLFNLVMTICFLIAGFMMGYLSAGHWALENPHWQRLPAIASGTLLVCALVFMADTFLQFKEYRRYTWHPNPQVPNGRGHDRLPY